MEIDIYQNCPCQSGKKIKFCCGKDIVGDLNRVLELNQSKQPVAALEHLERTIAKVGSRDCLQTIKTYLLINLHEYEQANDINEDFVRSHPKNPIGYQHRALLMASESRIEEAVQALQDALDLSPSNEVPLTMANAFRIVGLLLLSQGRAVAGRAHLIFASDLRQGNDESIDNLILQTYRSPALPLLLKQEFALADATPGAPWESIYNNALRFAARGRWRSALYRANKLLEDHPDEPVLLRAKAVWSSNLGDDENAWQAWQAVSDSESLDFEDRVEARIMSFLISDRPLTESLDVVKVGYEITDLERLKEYSAASPRMIAGFGMSRQAVDPDGPPPVGGFLILDQDEIKSMADKTDADFPKVIAEALMFGKQTDRDARIELLGVKDEHWTETENAITTQMESWLGERAEEIIIGQVPQSEHAMTARWHLPGDATVEQQQDWIKQQREKEMFNLWPTLSYSVLDGKSPREAAEDPGHRVSVAALISMMEQGADSQLHGLFDFDRLRNDLGIETPATIDPETSNATELSPLQQQRLDFEKLQDETLIKIYITASTIGNLSVIRSASPVILSRESLGDVLHFEIVYTTLAKITPDTQQAIEYMNQARQHAKAAGRSQGHLLVEELELLMERGMTESCTEILRAIRNNYADDHEVQYHLASVLARFGVIGPDGRPTAQAAEAASPQAQQESAIWTPESGAPVSAAPGEESDESKSQLWIPE